MVCVLWVLKGSLGPDLYFNLVLISSKCSNLCPDGCLIGPVCSHLGSEGFYGF